MVHPADSIEVAARAMRSYRTDSAAVVEPERRVTGGVLLSDLFPVIISRNELHGTVEASMSRDVVVLAQDDEIQKVYSRIVESGFSAFPVVKKKRLVGIISRRDLIGSRRMRTVIADHAHTPVGSVMTTDVVTIGPGEPVSAAAELLVKHDVSRLPVLDGDRLVGVIDRHDVLASLA
jgi:CBS domain-containing protein